MQFYGFRGNFRHFEEFVEFEATIRIKTEFNVSKISSWEKNGFSKMDCRGFDDVLDSESWKSKHSDAFLIDTGI